MQIADKFSMMNFIRNKIVKVHSNCKLKSIFYPEERKKERTHSFIYVMFNSLSYIYNVCFINCYFCGNMMFEYVHCTHILIKCTFFFG